MEELVSALVLTNLGFHSRRLELTNLEILKSGRPGDNVWKSKNLDSGMLGPTMAKQRDLEYL